MTSTNKIYLGVPLGVLRRFVEMNKDYDDSFMQMLEIQPHMIFTREMLESVGQPVENGSVIVDLEKMYGEKDDK